MDTTTVHHANTAAPHAAAPHTSTRWRRIAMYGAAVAAALMMAIAPAAAQAATTHPIGSYEKYPWSSTLYRVGTPFTATAVTYAQWTAAGSPGYKTTLVLGSSVNSYLTNPSEIFVGPFIDDNHPQVDLTHHVTYAEWTAIGSPAPRQQSWGFIKTAASPNIYQCGWTNSVPATLLSYSAWQRAGSPTPAVVATITGRCP